LKQTEEKKECKRSATATATATATAMAYNPHCCSGSPGHLSVWPTGTADGARFERTAGRLAMKEPKQDNNKTTRCIYNRRSSVLFVIKISFPLRSIARTASAPLWPFSETIRLRRSGPKRPLRQRPSCLMPEARSFVPPLLLYPTHIPRVRHCSPPSALTMRGARTVRLSRRLIAATRPSNTLTHCSLAELQ